MKRCLLPLIIICLAQTLCAQAPLVKMWDKRFGGLKHDHLTSLQTTTDGYILGGYSDSGIGGDKTQANWGTTQLNYWIVKIDSIGNKQWDKRFGGADESSWLKSLQQTTDGGYILGGSSYSGISGDKTQPTRGSADYWIVKIDSLGNKQWDKRFGGIYDDELNAIQQTTDGGYILGGYSRSDMNGDKTQPTRGDADYWIVKVDSLGNQQWDKRFGGISAEILFSLQQTLDGGYILAGSSDSGISGDKTELTRGYSDYWIVKVDSLGNKQWDRRFGGLDSDVLYSLQQTVDKGFILGGRSASSISGDKTQTLLDSPIDFTMNYGDYWIIKVDSLGNKEWDKTFGGTKAEDDFGNVFQTSDRGYLIAGTSYSSISGDKTEDDLGSEQVWIVKIDSLGNKQWDKTLFTIGHEEIAYAIESGNCYLIATWANGMIGGYKTQPNWDTTTLTYDYWIVKFCACASIDVTTNSVTAHVTCIGASDGAAKAVASGGTPPYTFLWSDGQADDSPTELSAGAHAVTVTDANGCTATTSINIGEGTEPCVGIHDAALNNITLHPNPTTNTLTITAPAIHAQATLTLVDALGKEVWQQTFFAEALKAGAQLTLSEQERGVYFLSIRTTQGAKVMKVVKY